MLWPLALVALTPTAPIFLDKSAELGLQLGNDAACWVDLNSDGFPELITGGTVWFNKRGTRFEKGPEVGSVVAGDYDNDGDPDLFSWSSLRLLRNDRENGFTGVSLPALPKTVSRGACWGDWNKDGFLDLYVGGYEDWNAGITYPSAALFNEGGRSFKLGWTESKYRTRGVTACDFDQDGDQDIYISNYRLQPNQLLVNDGKGAFSDQAGDRNAVATSPGFDGGHSIGAAWGDFDEDGAIDLFVGNFAHVDSRGDQPKSRFLKNLGRKGGFKFEDLGTCGVFYQESYASPAVGDFDNDGDLDLIFTTVYADASFGKKNYPVLFRNDGKFAFMDATELAGLTKLPATYQAAWSDFDRDGDLDLAVGGRLYVNQAIGLHWLEVQLVGDGKRINGSAIGSQVRLRLKDRVFTRQVEAGTGEGNQNDLTLHFGLGTSKGRVDLEIYWPDGKSQRVRGVAVDQIRVIRR